MSNERKALIVSFILFIIGVALILWSMRERAQPPSDNQLEQRVAEIEAWQDYVDPQIKQHGLDISKYGAEIIDLQDSQKLDSIQLANLDADVAILIEQVFRIRKGYINLKIDTTWIMGDSISIIGVKDSIFVRTKKH